MKSIKYYILTVCFATMLFSCSEDKLLVYEDKDQVYFNLVSYFRGYESYSDSMVVSFAFDIETKSDSVLYIPLNTVGRMSKVDREVSYSIESISTAKENQDFIVLSSAILADSISGGITIKIINSDILKTQSLDIVLKLQPNQNFSTDLHNMVHKDNNTYQVLQYKVLFNNIFGKPEVWTINEYWFDLFVGEYSETKLRLICQLFDLDVYEFVQNGFNYLSEGPIYSVTLKRYLEEQKAMGNTVYDENGKELTSGTYAG